MWTAVPTLWLLFCAGSVILDGLRAAGFTVTATVLTEGEQPWEPS
jgi:hypothetical protein